MRSGRDAYPLDDISKAIIEQLQQNGRRPYASIGKAVGLSEAAVRQRVQRLHRGRRDADRRGHRPVQLGFARQAMIGIQVDGDSPRSRRSSADARRRSTTSSSPPARSTSSPRSSARTTTHLLARDQRRIRSIPGVRTTETFVYLKLAKQTYTWGTR